jgi:hypothetical protein
MNNFINNILAQFDIFQKLNIKHALTKINIAKAALNICDAKQKTDFERSVPLAYMQFILTGSFPRFSYVKRSVAKFET